MELIDRLDLREFINSFTSLFAREKPIFMEGDLNYHHKFITELFKYDFSSPKSVEDVESSIMHIKKFGVLKPDEIFEFIKMVKYFKYLKKFDFKSEILIEWFSKIIIPTQIEEIDNFFNDKGELKSEIDEELASVEVAIKNSKARIKEQFLRVLNSSQLGAYLVDRQIHFINEEEALLVRGGFNHVLKASVIGRSSSGFFYVTPENVINLKNHHSELLAKKDKIIYEICKNISSIFLKNVLFLSFLNKEFDKFDHYQARVMFAKFKNLEFIIPSRDKKIILKNFTHPALLHPKATSINFEKSVLMITGVNAGGKTMLLKSILSSVFLAKYLIPMKINSQHSIIGSFKEIVPIIDDPQSVKNDISTFAGRMVEFSKLFAKKNSIVGVDEIELGTDSDEAASLFKVVIEELVKRDIKIVITTHHKRLASLLAAHQEVELVAALYDEKNQSPTYEFLQGTIGKSYAFETASRYGIPQTIISVAKRVYGEDKERLNELIERSSELEMELKQKKDKLEIEQEKVDNLKIDLIQKREDLKLELNELKSNLELEYKKAIDEAKMAIKAKDIKDSHRHLNEANKIVTNIKIEKKEEPIEFKIGDKVKYRNNKGIIVALKRQDATIEVDGIKLTVTKSELKHSSYIKPKQKSATINVTKPVQVSVNLDLHGLRAEEAIEKVDKFISDSLLLGFDEILIYHGIGSGKLAFAVREFLKTQPIVKEFYDAPINMGGHGATIVRF